MTPVPMWKACCNLEEKQKQSLCKQVCQHVLDSQRFCVADSNKPDSEESQESIPAVTEQKHSSEQHNTRCFSTVVAQLQQHIAHGISSSSVYFFGHDLPNGKLFQRPF